jgi:hypothetical protein
MGGWFRQQDLGWNGRDIRIWTISLTSTGVAADPDTTSWAGGRRWHGASSDGRIQRSRTRQARCCEDRCERQVRIADLICHGTAGRHLSSMDSTEARRLLC